MGFGREIEQLRRRANKAAIHVRAPQIKMHVLNEGDPEPEDLDAWSIVIRIESSVIIIKVALSRPFRFREQKTPRTGALGVFL